jgi:integrase
MARPHKPWYWKARQAWTVEIDGRRHILAKGPQAQTRTEAMRVFHALMAERDRAASTTPRAPPPALTVGGLCDHYLEWIAHTRRPLTLEWYQRHLSGFAAHVGVDTAAGIIRPRHVTGWLQAHGWSPSTECGAITAVKAAWSWGRKQGYLDDDPLKVMDRPPIATRDEILSEEQFEATLAATKDREFRDFLTVMHETGMRPSEAMALEARHIDFEARAAVLDSKTTSTTGRKRVVYLSDRALDLFRELAGRWPEGPILRNTRGRPWTRFATKCRFWRLRNKLGFGHELTAESLRHGYLTDALEQGTPIATVAELAGHKGTQMIERRYSKLYQRRGHLRDAARSIRPGPDGASDPEPGLES